MENLCNRSLSRELKVSFGENSLAGFLAHQCVLRNTMAGSKIVGSTCRMDPVRSSMLIVLSPTYYTSAEPPLAHGAVFQPCHSAHRAALSWSASKEKDVVVFLRRL